MTISMGLSLKQAGQKEISISNSRTDTTFQNEDILEAPTYRFLPGPDIHTHSTVRLPSTCPKHLPARDEHIVGNLTLLQEVQ